MYSYSMPRVHKKASTPPDDEKGEGGSEAAHTHTPPALALQWVREVSSPRRRRVRRQNLLPHPPKKQEPPHLHAHNTTKALLEQNKLVLIEPLPLPDDDAGGVPAINGDAKPLS